VSRGAYRFQVLITTYETVLADLALLSGIRWRCAVVDEAHRIKNRESKQFRALSDFTLDHCVFLTGTPIQNNLNELFTVGCACTETGRRAVTALPRTAAPLPRCRQVPHPGKLKRVRAPPACPLAHASPAHAARV
jgi:hypothetical protein